VLQLGPSNDSAEDSEKLQVYKELLKVAGLTATIESPELKNVTDADTYRRASRAKIVESLTGKTPSAITTFMKASVAVTPGAYNRARSEIYEEAVSQHPQFQYERTNPAFLVSRYKDLEHDRIADGESGNSLYEAKGHAGTGPGAQDKDQAAKYSIITRNLYKTGPPPDGKSYVQVVYVITSEDAREKWRSLLNIPNVRVLPPD